MQRLLTSGVTAVLWYLKDWKNKQKLFFLLQVMFIAARWSLTEGKPFCDPSWMPRAFSLFKHLELCHDCVKQQWTYSLWEQITKPNRFQFLVLVDKNVYVLTPLCFQIRGFFFPWIPTCPYYDWVWGRQLGVAGWGVLESHRHELGPGTHHLPAVWAWVPYFNFLRLSFLVFKMGSVTPTFRECCGGR